MPNWPEPIKSIEQKKAEQKKEYTEGDHSAVKEGETVEGTKSAAGTASDDVIQPLTDPDSKEPTVAAPGIDAGTKVTNEQNMPHASGEGSTSFDLNHPLSNKFSGAGTDAVESTSGEKQGSAVSSDKDKLPIQKFQPPVELSAEGEEALRQTKEKLLAQEREAQEVKQKNDARQAKQVAIAKKLEDAQRGRPISEIPQDDAYWTVANEVRKELAQA